MQSLRFENWRKGQVTDYTMPNPTRSNHFSPVFTNRYWEQRGTICRLYRSESGAVRHGRTSAKTWGCENNLHPQDVENAFSRVEQAVAPIYRKLVDGQILGPVERLVWSHWILCQFARTPTMMLEIAGLEERVFSRFGVEHRDPWPVVSSKIESLSAFGLEFPQSKALLAYISMRDWLLLRPAEEEFFIRGDTPIVIQGALVNDDAKIIYPLAPDRCFVATVLGSFPPSQYQAERTLRSGESKELQRLIASRAERQVICRPDHLSPDLISLVDRHLGTDARVIRLSTFADW